MMPVDEWSAICTGDETEMKLEEGAYYRARNGSVHGPMKQFLDERFVITIGDGVAWNFDGACVIHNSLPEKDKSKLDLISRVYVSDTPPPVKKEHRPFQVGEKVRVVIANVAVVGVLVKCVGNRVWKAEAQTSSVTKKTLEFFIHERQITHRIVKKPRAARREFWIEPGHPDRGSQLFGASIEPRDGWIHVKEVKESK